MRVFGHRGSRRPGPENTVGAVRAALLAGADGVEVDIRRSPSGLHCRHDPSNDGDREDAPSVASVLDAARGRGRVICEVKNRLGDPDFDAPAEATAALLVKLLAERAAASGPGRAATDDVVVSSFDWYAIELVRDAGLRTGFLTPPGVTVGAGLAYVTSAGHPELHAHVNAVLEDPDAVRRAQSAGVEVVVWTVEAAQVQELQRLGVAGVIVDDPAAVVRGLRAPARGRSGDATPGDATPGDAT